LLNLGANVPTDTNQLTHLFVGPVDGGNVQLEATIAAAQNAGGDGPTCQRRVERTVVGTNDIWRAQRFIEASTACGSVTPFVEGGIGPGNAKIGADDSHTIRQRVENAFRLNEILGPRQHCGIECIRVDSVKTLAVEKGQPSSRTVHSNELPVRLAALQEIPG